MFKSVSVFKWTILTLLFKQKLSWWSYFQGVSHGAILIVKDISSIFIFSWLVVFLFLMLIGFLKIIVKCTSQLSKLWRHFNTYFNFREKEAEIRWKMGKLWLPIIMAQLWIKYFLWHQKHTPWWHQKSEIQSLSLIYRGVFCPCPITHLEWTI